ncbi:MAG TPA: hypothetical protein PK765_05985 [bacterium]|nr:hypothetical protein [bacterium]
MQFVEPIRDIKKLAQIKNLLRGEGNVRDLLLFELGVNSALRCSDLLALRVRDVFAADGSVLDSFEVREKKTGKRSKVSITPKVRTTLGEYRRAYPEVCHVPENFLFFARKSYPL